MSNTAEDYSFLKAMMPATVDNKFQEKTWNYAESIESTYTNGQCSFDLSTFANSKNAMVWSTAFIVLPLMIVMSNNSIGGAPVSFHRSDYAVALKSCYSSLINSVQVILSDKTLNTSTPNIFLYNTLKQLAEGSVQSERTKGHLGLFIDDADAFAYNPNGLGIGNAITADNNTAPQWKNKNGNGLLCNFWKSSEDGYLNVSEAKGSNFGKSQNEGGKKRCQESSDNANRYVSLFNNNNSGPELKDYSTYYGVSSQAGLVDTASGARASDYQVWYKNVCIRVSDILDLFGDVDMVKGGYFKINLNLNLGSCAISTVVNKQMRPLTMTGFVGAATTGNTSTTPVAVNRAITYTTPPANNHTIALFKGETTFQQGCPLLINPSGINIIGADDTAGVASQTIVFGLHMGQVGGSVPQYTQQNSLGISPHPLGKARIYLESVVLDEESNLKLFDSMGAVKNIDYNDVVYNIIPNISPSATASYQVGNNNKGSHTLILIPRVADSAHGALTTAQLEQLTGTAGLPNVNGFSQWVSPFYPFQGAPLSINKVQVTVNGKSLYPNMLDYTYQMYVENWNVWRTTNGNVSDGALQSGMLSKKDWEIFRTYVFTWPVEDNNVGNNVNITFMNNSQVLSTYDCFLVCRKSIKLNTLNGKVEEANF
jgi:hypothetical protein